MKSNREQLSELALRIAADLFTNGSGKKAERLLLWRDSDQQEMGGWSEKPLAARILMHLEEQNAE